MQEALDETKNDLAKRGVSELKATSPRSHGKSRSGTYAKSWTKKKWKRSLVIFNKEYQLTHLLEKGHAQVGGGRVAPRVHIAPVEKLLAGLAERMFKSKLK